jgi:flagella basal body P-ring formation protein FlgA
MSVRTVRSPWFASILIGLALMWVSPAHASGGDPVEEAVRRLVEKELGSDTAHSRVQVAVGQLDPRVRLAPCDRAEPFVPPGTRLWGRSQVGIRCTAGASWMVRLPVTVQVFGQVPVAGQALAAGSVLTPGDFRLEEVELTRDPAPLVTDPGTLAGKQLTRTIAAGHPFRVDSVRIPASVNAGDPVQILITGQGFALAGSGVALASASEGQVLRARTETGRVVAGTLRDRTVELRL